MAAVGRKSLGEVIGQQLGEEVLGQVGGVLGRMSFAAHVGVERLPVVPADLFQCSVGRFRTGPPGPQDHAPACRCEDPAPGRDGAME